MGDPGAAAAGWKAAAVVQDHAGRRGEAAPRLLKTCSYGSCTRLSARCLPGCARPDLPLTLDTGRATDGARCPTVAAAAWAGEAQSSGASTGAMTTRTGANSKGAEDTAPTPLHRGTVTPIRPLTVVAPSRTWKGAVPARATGELSTRSCTVCELRPQKGDGSCRTLCQPCYRAARMLYWYWKRKGFTVGYI
jgi:hypothetical protein